MSKLKETFTAIKNSVRENIPEYTLLLSILIYILAFSGHMLAKHEGFATFAWDLGIFDQSFFTTVFEGKLFYSTAELYQNPSGSYFGSKFSPILGLLLPFYILAPGARTLLVLKTVILAIAAYPLYLLTKTMTGDRQTSLLVAFSYLLYPGLHGANNFDFQQQIFIPVVIFSLTYCLIKKKWRYYSVFYILSLTITEHTAIIVSLLTAYLFITIVRSSPKHETRVKKEKILLASSVFAFTSFFISKYIRSLYPVNQRFIDFYQASSTLGVLGFKQDIVYLPLYLIQNIDKVIEAISYDYLFKFLYLIFLLAPLLFIPLKSGLMFGFLILATPFIISNYRPYYMLGTHYSLYLLPFVFLAMLEGLSRTKLSEPHHLVSDEVKPHIRNDARLIVIISILFALSLSPLSPVSTIIKRSNPILWYADTYQNDAYVDSIHKLIDLVPPQSSILVQNNIFPHVSNRLNAYVVPVISSPEVEDVLESWISWEVNASEYILVDLEAYDIWRDYLLDVINNNGEVIPYAFARSSILFKKNFSGDPIFVPDTNQQVFLAHSDMHHYKEALVEDLTTKTGYSVFSPMQKTSNYVIYGPYIALPPGPYDAIFTIKITDYNDTEIAIFDVSDEWGNTILSSTTMDSSMVELGKWVNISVPFYLEKLRTKMEFRVFTTGSAEIYCYKVTVMKTDFLDMVFYPITDLAVDQGRKIEDNSSETGYVIFAEKAKTTGTVLYGPYISLFPGSYIAEYWLKITENTSSMIVAMDVATMEGKNVIARKELFGGDFNGSEWGQYTLPFQVNSISDLYEFRVFTTGYVDLYFEKIIIRKTDD